MIDLDHIYSDEEIIDRITNLHEGLEKFWANSEGWAPVKAAELLTKSRLDWQVSLSRHLKVFLDTKVQKESGALILAWSALGSLTEGIMKLFLSVYYDNYKVEEFNEDLKVIRDNKGNLIDPDNLVLEKLRVFFAQKVYPDTKRKIWKDNCETDWIEWILYIQQKRNAIHSFKDRDIADFNDFYKNLRLYLKFLRKLSYQLPYPAEMYMPRE